MNSFTKFSLRFGAYLLVLGYLAGDLYIFNGPLNRRIQASNPNSPESIAMAKANGVVARVFNHQITRTQLDYAIHERLWLEGKELADLSPDAKKLITYAALGELIDHELIRVKAKVNTKELPVSDQETDERIKRFASRFETKGHLEAAMKSMGIADETALRNRIAARIQQEKYVAMRVDPLVKVSEGEIAEFHQTHKQDLTVPERIRASHIFIATLNKPSEEAKATLESALADLKAEKKDFATLAKELSEDTSTKQKAGDLGWMSRKRLPVDFAESVFHLPKDSPTLIRTKLGWHIVTVTDRKAAKLRSIDECREEIIAALSATKRHQAVNDFRSALRRFETEKIDIFHDQLTP
ncbi:peptidylprolyl isomerase [Akkermansiaceae bacterium]|nr:peptidylprolyl isomerase [Akkermansiaceae bacterium]